MLGGLLLGILGFFTGLGASLASFFYTVYHLLFVKEDKIKGTDKDYTIRQGREIK